MSYLNLSKSIAAAKKGWGCGNDQTILEGMAVPTKGDNRQA